MSFDAEFSNQGKVTEPDAPTGALTKGLRKAVAFSENQRGEVLEKETADSLKTGGGKPGQGYPAARVGGQVRRLTPTECERLMGWPDGWTVLDEVEGDPNPAPDSRRYAACGDGVVAHVAEWIARRLSPYVSAPDGRS